MPVVSSVMTLVELVVLALGVSVAVQEIPPSPLVRLERVALGALRSAMVKPLTASAKETVTVAVSPIFREVSLMVMDDVRAGLWVSIA